MPGGSDTINQSFYESETDLKTRIEHLQVGMTENQVFSQLGRHEDHFIMLSRNEILSALYGENRSDLSQSYHSPLYTADLQSLRGYKLIFKNVERSHGISSPIAMRTDEVGFSYTATLIFKNGYLYEKPVLSGGAVDAKSTKTIFDYLSPGSVMNRIPI